MNYLENSGRNDFVICDDATGTMLDVSQRVDAIATLKIVHEVYGIIQRTTDPPVATFEIHRSLRALCQHFGWAPGDIALVEHYANATQAIVDNGSTSRTG